MKQAQPISIIIPTLNEADNLPILFERIDAALGKARIPYEVIIVDDHSTDSTKAVAEQSNAKYGVRVKTKRGKQGKAYSLLEGFAAAKYNLICMVDADLQYPPEAIPNMYHKMQFCNADIVITNRIDNQTSRLRKLSSGAFHLVFTRALFGIQYDTQSGLKLFKKNVLEDIHINPSAWTFDLEFIIRSLENRYTILSEDIAFGKRYAGEAKINLFSAAFEGGWQSLKLWRTTPVKRVKAHYKRLQPLQRRSANGFLGLAGFLVGLSFFGMVSTHQTSALSNPFSKKSDTTQKSTDDNATSNPVSKLLNNLLGTTPTAATPTTSSSTPAATTSPTTTSPAATTTPTAQPGTTSPASSTTPTTSSTPTTTTTAATTNPITLTPQTGKNAAYYTNSKLSSNKTNQFLRLAIYSLEIGGGFVILGILFVGIKKLRSKMRRQQPIWNS